MIISFNNLFYGWKKKSKQNVQNPQKICRLNVVRCRCEDNKFIARFSRLFFSRTYVKRIRLVCSFCGCGNISDGQNNGNSACCIRHSFRFSIFFAFCFCFFLLTWLDLNAALLLFLFFVFSVYPV